ncbi:MAG: P-loop NTPase [Methanosarcinaceae archaeon]|nr:P-loop NTPase [Methanosarcinaceae archaeon]
MKILVCGKGGCGKSTLTALLAQAMCRQGYNVLVVDNDESNFGLHRQLGMELPQDFLNYFGGKKELVEKMMKAFSSGEKATFFEHRWEISDIPEAYVSKNGNLSLMAVGKIHDSGEGCACPMGALSKQLLKNIDTSSNDFVLVDTEAGIEHFGRGVEEGCDILLMVVDPSYESIRLAEKISSLADSIEKPLYYICNRIEDASMEILLDAIPGSKILATVPINGSIFKAGLLGEEFRINVPEIEELSGFLKNMQESEYQN